MADVLAPRSAAAGPSPLDRGRRDSMASNGTATPGTAPPGTAHARLNYELAETAMRTKVSAKVREARQHVETHYKADVLGLRGSNWNSSVSPDPQRELKHTMAAADARLTNTLQPKHIDKTNLRSTTGAMFEPACPSSRPAAFNRSTPEWGISASTWTLSTAQDEQREKQARLDDLTVRSRKTTKKVPPPATYLTPEQRQQEIIERMREQKRNEGVDYNALVAQFGPEGAEAMLHIQGLKQQQQRAGSDGGSTMRRTQISKPKPSIRDMEAVKLLPDPGSDEEGGEEREGDEEGEDVVGEEAEMV